MGFRRAVTRAEHLLAMRAVTCNSQSSRWALCRVGRHLGLGRRRAIGGLLPVLVERGDVVDDLELATLLGGPEKD